jgi:hypothetical protein
MTNDYIYLRRAPGLCCPDAHCDYSSWDGKTCKYCDAVCKKCIHNKKGFIHDCVEALKKLTKRQDSKGDEKK